MDPQCKTLNVATGAERSVLLSQCRPLLNALGEPLLPVCTGDGVEFFNDGEKLFDIRPMYPSSEAVKAIWRWVADEADQKPFGYAVAV